MKTFASVFTIISLYVSCEELHQNVQEAAGSYDLYPQAPDYYSVSDTFYIISIFSEIGS